MEKKRYYLKGLNSRGVQEEVDPVALTDPEDFYSKKPFVEEAKERSKSGGKYVVIDSDGVVVAKIHPPNQKYFLRSADIMSSTFLDDISSLFETSRSEMKAAIDAWLEVNKS